MKLCTSAYSGTPGNCAVTALHEVAPHDWSEADVLEAATTCGFPYDPSSGGMECPDIQATMDMLCLDRSKYIMYRASARPTLAQFARLHPQGVFYIVTRDHALVIRDGQVVDPNAWGRRKLRRRVWLFWQIYNAGPGHYEPADRK